MDLEQLLFAVRLGVCLTLTLICFAQSRRLNSLGNLSLGLFFALLTLLFFTEFDQAFPALIILDWVVDYLLLLPPLLLLSVYLFTRPAASLDKRLVVGLLSVLTLCVSIHTFKPYDHWEAFDQVESILFTVIGIVSLLVCLRLLVSHQKRIRTLNAAVQHIDLKWLHQVLLLTPLLWLCGLVIMLSSVPDWLYLVADTLILFILLYIVVHKIEEREVYLSHEAAIVEELIAVDDKVPLLDARAKAQLVQQLEQLMQVKKQYLDQQISLPILAEKLNVRPHQLSWLLNTHYDINFYTYINNFRIQDSQSMLLDEQFDHLSIQGIATEVGFKSKTAFYSNFKRVTGQTPSEYRKQRRDLS